MLKKLLLYCSIALLLPAGNAFAQYTMGNKTVFACEGTMTDSEKGPTPTWYDHNEDYVFTICVPGSSEITLVFTSFKTEAKFDFIEFFDGPNMASPKIAGPFSGDSIPPTIKSTGSCLTIHFKSDANVAAPGWICNWTVKIPQITAPNIAPLGTIPCSTAVLDLVLDKAVPCLVVDKANFALNGPGSGGISNAVPNPCVGDSTRNIRLVLGSPINKSGNYTVTFNYSILDVCLKPHNFNLSTSFNVIDCPLEVYIDAAPPVVCLGSCTTLHAVVSGGNPGTYSYQWSNSLPSTEYVNVCPNVRTTYYVTVDDNGPARSATASFVVNIATPPSLEVPPGKNIVCLNTLPFNLTAIPPGGTWSGKGVTNANNGAFDPSQTQPGTAWVSYTAPNGCKDSVSITILPISAGADEGACPGTPVFLLSGQNPPGGTWSGSPYVQANGNFNPSTVGIHTVTYRAPNGCQTSKKVNVTALTVPNAFAKCINDQRFDMFAQTNPKGGQWTGPGIVDAWTGAIEPRNAGPGIHNYTYQAHGCNGSVSITINDIYAGRDTMACPQQLAFNLSGNRPPGGLWSGNGIVNPNAGTFNPGVNGGSNFVAQVFYSNNGCIDTASIQVIKTRLLQDSITFCPYDPDYRLNNVGIVPTVGSWSGSGVVNGRFNPSLNGSGVYIVNYTANTCIAPLHITVFPQIALQSDTSVCAASGPFTLKSYTNPGSWSGKGITNPAQGTFSPASSGNGVFSIRFTTASGCSDSLKVTVTAMPVVRLFGLDSVYCYKDTLYTLKGSPLGGIFSGTGVTDTTFRPAIAGSGWHKLVYSVGTGVCQVNDTFPVRIRKPLQVSISNAPDSICPGDSMIIEAIALEGRGKNYMYSWANGLGPGPKRYVVFTKDTTLIVNCSDACSNPVSDTAYVRVLPDFQITINTSDTLCYGKSGWAKVKAFPPGSYSYTWSTTPQQHSDSINITTGKYFVSVVNNATSCLKKLRTTVPFYTPLKANFSTVPGDECASILNPKFYIVDLSTGAKKGSWSWGDTTINTAYISNADSIVHTYADTGVYYIALYVENEGGCRDTAFGKACVLRARTLFVPNVFTPNGDGLNDYFFPEGLELNRYTMQIFDRYGNLTWESDPNEPKPRWDGRSSIPYKNTSAEYVQNDVYVYMISYRYPEQRRRTTLYGKVIVIR